MALNRSDKSRILRRYFPRMTRNSEMSTEPRISVRFSGEATGSGKGAATAVLARYVVCPECSDSGRLGTGAGGWLFLFAQTGWKRSWWLVGYG